MQTGLIFYKNKCLSGFGAVIGVKGDKETEYRCGNVNLTAEDVGAVPTSSVVNNSTTTAAGFALDARQANPNVEGSLAKQISELNSSLKNYLPSTVLTKNIDFGKSYNGITHVWYRQYGRIACVTIEGTADKDYIAGTPYIIADAADFNIGDGWHGSVEFNTGATMGVYKSGDYITTIFHQSILKGMNIFAHFTYIVW